MIEEAFRVLDKEVLELDDVEQAWYAYLVLPWPLLPARHGMATRPSPPNPLTHSLAHST